MRFFTKHPNVLSGPDMWSTLGYPQCGGDRQSPIHLDTNEIPKYEYDDLIVFKHYSDVARKITVRNNGRTRKLGIAESEMCMQYACMHLSNYTAMACRLPSKCHTSNIF